MFCVSKLSAWLSCVASDFLKTVLVALESANLPHLSLTFWLGGLFSPAAFLKYCALLFSSILAFRLLFPPCVVFQVVPPNISGSHFLDSLRWHRPKFSPYFE